MKSFRRSGVVHLERGQKIFLGLVMTGLFSLPVACTLGVKPDSLTQGGGPTERFVIEPDREPAASRAPVDPDKQTAQAIYLALKMIQKDAQSLGRESVVKEGRYLWGAIRAFNQSDSHAGKLLVGQFLEANKANPYLKYVFNGGTSLRPEDKKIVDSFNVHFQGDRLKRMATKVLLSYQGEIENAWNSHNPATQGNTSWSNLTRWGYSNQFGYNRTAGAAKEKLDATLLDFRQYLKSTGAQKSMDFLNQFQLFSNIMEASSNSLRSGLQSFPLHVKMIEMLVGNFKNTGKFFTLKHPQDAGAMASQIISLRSDIFEMERGQEVSRLYWEAGKLSAEVTGLYILALGSAAAMIVPGLQGVGLAGVGASLTTMSAIIGSAYAVAGATGALDHMTRVGNDQLTHDDWKQFGMNVVMMVGLGGARLTSSARLTGMLRATMAGRNALAAARYVTLGANAYMMIDQGIMAGYMLLNAKQISEQTGQSMYEVRLMGFMNALLAVTGGLNAAKETRAFLKEHPADFRIQWARYDGTPDAPTSARPVAETPTQGTQSHAQTENPARANENTSEGVTEFSDLVDNFRRQGQDQEVVQTVNELADFETSFLNNRANQTTAKADEYMGNYREKADRLINEGTALREGARRMNGEEKAKSLADAREKIQAGRLFEAAIRAAKYVKSNLPLFARMDRVVEHAGKVDDLMDQANSAADHRATDDGTMSQGEYLGSHTRSLDLYQQAKVEVEGAITEATTILEALNTARRTDGHEYARIKDVLEDLQTHTRLVSVKIEEQQALIARLRANPASGTAVAEGGRTAAPAPVDLRRSPAYEGLTAEQRSTLDPILNDPAQRGSLESMVGRKLSEARSRGISEEAFNRVLKESLGACLRR